MKICSSSTGTPSYGSASRIVGPPVENSKACPPSTLPPANETRSAFKRKPQRTPAGRSRPKSYTQFFWSAQRAVPGSGHSISKGSGRRGSPKATMGSEKRTATWRTPLTSPCGENTSTCAAEAAPAANSITIAVQVALILRAPCVRSPLADSRSAPSRQSFTNSRGRRKPGNRNEKAAWMAVFPDLPADAFTPAAGVRVIAPLRFCSASRKRLPVSTPRDYWGGPLPTCAAS